MIPNMDAGFSEAVWFNKINSIQEAAWEIPGRKPVAAWPQAGEIAFNGYKSRYRPGLDLVLRNVTCKINPGEKVRKRNIQLVVSEFAHFSNLQMQNFSVLDWNSWKDWCWEKFHDFSRVQNR